MSKLDKGYSMISRRLLDSDIYRKPPHYERVWVYLIVSSVKGVVCEVSINDILEGTHWLIGFRKCYYKDWQIKRVLEYMTGEDMVNIEHNGKTMNITLVNHEIYSNPNSYNKKDVLSKEVNISFEKWWKEYDKKVGKESEIEKKWNKLKDKDRETAYNHTIEYVKNREKKFRKDPERYLNHEEYHNEIINYEQKESGNTRADKEVNEDWM